MTFNPPATLKWILGAYNKLKQIYRDSRRIHKVGPQKDHKVSGYVLHIPYVVWAEIKYVEWAEKPAAHDMVKKFLSGIPNTHCGMGLSIALQDENRF